SRSAVIPPRLDACKRDTEVLLELHLWPCPIIGYAGLGKVVAAKRRPPVFKRMFDAIVVGVSDNTRVRDAEGGLGFQEKHLSGGHPDSWFAVQLEACAEVRLVVIAAVVVGRFGYRQGIGQTDVYGVVAVGRGVGGAGKLV